MRMTPSVPLDTESRGEKTIFELLEASDLGPHARAFHSLNISEHDYKLCGELDFVVLCPDGLFVLEVKSGRVALRDGLWTYTDRYGRGHTNTEGPFRQGRSGMFALRDRLRSDLPRAATAGLVFGHAVVFPGTEFPHASAEWTPAMVIDAEKLRGRRDLTEPLQELIAYWSAKTRGAAKVAPSRLDLIGGFLRPDFDKVPSLRHRADQMYTAMERLTEEQYRQLDLVEESDRVVCAGGAGTGKTFLAAEIARRDAAHGDRVLLTCKSRVLACFLRDRLREHGQIDVVAYSDTVGITRRYDVLVVDEAQDLLEFENLDHFSTLVEDGLEGGRWRFFYDANNQSSLSGRFDPEALAYLRSLAGAAGSLRRNCRNTKSIVTQTRLVTRADLGNPAAGIGEPVDYAYWADKADETAMLERHLRELLDNDVPPGEISVISPLPFERSCVAHMRTKWRRRIHVIDPNAEFEWPIDEISFATVADFKGLENQFISLVDVDAVAGEGRTRAVLYVAMSRARAGLWIAVRKDLEEQLEAIKRLNLADVLEGDAVGTR
jgi:Nuclease-related domain/AAA domain/UvrD-like helicase C-terminal domain